MILFFQLKHVERAVALKIRYIYFEKFENHATAIF